VPQGKLLGFIVSHRGIEANPEKINAIIAMDSPRMINNVQKLTHVLVAIDKVTKWIEYKPIATLSADRVVTFTCDILHCFGFPNTIITYLGSNFHSHQFQDFCERSSIEVKYVSVAHPRANGQVERANGLIFTHGF
jgi:hypothetical protein